MFGGRVCEVRSTNVPQKETQSIPYAAACMTAVRLCKITSSESKRVNKFKVLMGYFRRTNSHKVTKAALCLFVFLDYFMLSIIFGAARQSFSCFAIFIWLSSHKAFRSPGQSFWSLCSSKDEQSISQCC